MDIVLVLARVHELICAKYLSSPNVLQKYSLTIGSTLNSANNKISVNQKLCIRFVDQCCFFCNYKVLDASPYTYLSIK